MTMKILKIVVGLLVLGLALFLFRTYSHDTKNRASIDRGLNASGAAAQRQNSVPYRPAHQPQPGERTR